MTHMDSCHALNTMRYYYIEGLVHGKTMISVNSNIYEITFWIPKKINPTNGYVVLDSHFFKIFIIKKFASKRLTVNTPARPL